MNEDDSQKNEGKTLRHLISSLFKKDNKIWSFIWGVVSASIFVVLGYYFSTTYKLDPYTYPIVLYVVLIIFSGTVGLYFADFWKNNEDSIALSFGFLLVLLISTIFLLWDKVIVDILLLLGFLFGFAFVMSGAVVKQEQILKFLKKLLKKFSWYIFGLELTTSFEIPLFQKVINLNEVNIENTVLITVIGVAYIAFVVVVNKYIRDQ